MKKVGGRIKSDVINHFRFCENESWKYLTSLIWDMLHLICSLHFFHINFLFSKIKIFILYKFQICCSLLYILHLICLLHFFTYYLCFAKIKIFILYNLQIFCYWLYILHLICLLDFFTYYLFFLQKLTSLFSTN